MTAPGIPQGHGAPVGTLEHAGRTFRVYDDGSLVEGRTWYEDPRCCARDLGIDGDALAARVQTTIAEATMEFRRAMIAGGGM